MKIDSHQHFWRYSTAEYPWIGGGMERLARDYLPSELATIAAVEGIAGTIAVQARQTAEESRWLLALADAHPLIAGVVGWVDLRSDRVGDDLAAFARHPKFVGVRHVVQDEPDDRFLLGEAFVTGLRQLRPFGLAYDLLIYPKQLPAAIELVGLLPDQPFVLDHLAKPALKSAVHDPGAITPWRTDIARLARHPNVWCKVSGLVTEAAWCGWKRSDFTTCLEVVLEAFGSQRLMFGSDWPVCLLAAEYAEVAAIAREFFADLAEVEQEAVWGGNARRFYGLE